MMESNKEKVLPVEMNDQKVTDHPHIPIFADNEKLPTKDNVVLPNVSETRSGNNGNNEIGMTSTVQSVNGSLNPQTSPLSEICFSNVPDLNVNILLQNAKLSMLKLHKGTWEEMKQRQKMFKSASNVAFWGEKQQKSFLRIAKSFKYISMINFDETKSVLTDTAVMPNNAANNADNAENSLTETTKSDGTIDPTTTAYLTTSIVTTNEEESTAVVSNSIEAPQKSAEKDEDDDGDAELSLQTAVADPNRPTVHKIHIPHFQVSRDIFPTSTTAIVRGSTAGAILQNSKANNSTSAKTPYKPQVGSFGSDSLKMAGFHGIKMYLEGVTPKRDTYVALGNLGIKEGWANAITNPCFCTDDEPLAGWRRELSIRMTGKTKGSADIYFVTPDRKKRIRSKNDMQMYLTNNSYSLSILSKFSYHTAFCVCQQKEEGQYIECSFGKAGCNGWIHPHCVGLGRKTKEELSFLHKVVCPFCAAYLQAADEIDEHRRDPQTLILTEITAPQEERDYGAAYNGHNNNSNSNNNTSNDNNGGGSNRVTINDHVIEEYQEVESNCWAMQIKDNLGFTAPLSSADSSAASDVACSVASVVGTNIGNSSFELRAESIKYVDLAMTAINSAATATTATTISAIPATTETAQDLTASVDATTAATVSDRDVAATMPVMVGVAKITNISDNDITATRTEVTSVLSRVVHQIENRNVANRSVEYFGVLVNIPVIKLPPPAPVALPATVSANNNINMANNNSVYSSNHSSTGVNTTSTTVQPPSIIDLTDSSVLHQLTKRTLVHTDPKINSMLQHRLFQFILPTTNTVTTNAISNSTANKSTPSEDKDNSDSNNDNNYDDGNDDTDTAGSIYYVNSDSNSGNNKRKYASEDSAVTSSEQQQPVKKKSNRSKLLEKRKLAIMIKDSNNSAENNDDILSEESDGEDYFPDYFSWEPSAEQVESSVRRFAIPQYQFFDPNIEPKDRAYKFTPPINTATDTTVTTVATGAANTTDSADLGSLESTTASISYKYNIIKQGEMVNIRVTGGWMRSDININTNVTTNSNSYAVIAASQNRDSRGIVLSNNSNNDDNTALLSAYDQDMRDRILAKAAGIQSRHLAYRRGVMCLDNGNNNSYRTINSTISTNNNSIINGNSISNSNSIAVTDSYVEPLAPYDTQLKLNILSAATAAAHGVTRSTGKSKHNNQYTVNKDSISNSNNTATAGDSTTIIPATATPAVPPVLLPAYGFIPTMDGGVVYTWLSGFAYVDKLNVQKVLYNASVLKSNTDFVSPVLENNIMCGFCYTSHNNNTNNTNNTNNINNNSNNINNSNNNSNNKDSISQKFTTDDALNFIDYLQHFTESNKNIDSGDTDTTNNKNKNKTNKQNKALPENVSSNNINSSIGVYFGCKMHKQCQHMVDEWATVQNTLFNYNNSNNNNNSNFSDVNNSNNNSNGDSNNNDNNSDVNCNGDSNNNSSSGVVVCGLITCDNNVLAYKHKIERQLQREIRKQNKIQQQLLNSNSIGIATANVSEVVVLEDNSVFTELADSELSTAMDVTNTSVVESESTTAQIETSAQSTQSTAAAKLFDDIVTQDSVETVVIDLSGNGSGEMVSSTSEENKEPTTTSHSAADADADANSNSDSGSDEPVLLDFYCNICGRDGDHGVMLQYRLSGSSDVKLGHFPCVYFLHNSHFLKNTNNNTSNSSNSTDDSIVVVGSGDSDSIGNQHQKTLEDNEVVEMDVEEDTSTENASSAQPNAYSGSTALVSEHNEAVVTSANNELSHSDQQLLGPSQSLDQQFASLCGKYRCNFCGLQAGIVMRCASVNCFCAAHPLCVFEVSQHTKHSMQSVKLNGNGNGASGGIEKKGDEVLAYFCALHNVV